MRFVENNVLCLKYINKYEFRRVWGGHIWSTIHVLFIIKKKTEKVQEYLYLNQILHHFDLTIFFLG